MFVCGGFAIMLRANSRLLNSKNIVIIVENSKAVGVTCSGNSQHPKTPVHKTVMSRIE